MRRVRRLPLDQAVQSTLDERQAEVNRKRNDPDFSATGEWDGARKTQSLKSVLAMLWRMMGERQRCMYCLDSHGTDIEHFWPKTPYPERMFVWSNLLLCCVECGRFKGNQFPLEQGLPLLVDPTAEDPWLFLDFDPATGNVVPRFDRDLNHYSIKGTETVKLLQLDRREAMAAGYKKTVNGLSRLVESVVNQSNPTEDVVIAELREADDHGLLGWCLWGSGQNERPFSDLRKQHPALWDACVREFRDI
jgi:uncharacterized protein (TIGR02646 family)